MEYEEHERLVNILMDYEDTFRHARRSIDKTRDKAEIQRILEKMAGELRALDPIPQLEL